MTWQADPAATRLAEGVFHGYQPTVRRDGNHYLLDRTPYGRMELVSVRGQYLVAAETLPADAPRLDASRLPEEVRGHLDRHHLKPWKVVPGGDLGDVLRRLDGPDAAEPGPDWSAYLCPVAEPPDLVGEPRQRVADLLPGLLDAQAFGSPLAALVGPAGVGRRAVAATAARRLGLVPLELPLGRLLIDRIFSTPEETLLATLLAAGPWLVRGRDLLVLSGAEALARLRPPVRQPMLLEMTRLPHVVLLSTDPALAEVGGVAALACPGLAGVGEARQVLGRAYPALDLVGPVLEMVCQAAGLPRVGILPGRLLYVVRLAMALRPASDGPASAFSPDEAALAIRLAQAAWESGPGAAETL